MTEPGVRQWHQEQVRAYAAVRSIYVTYARTLHELLEDACRNLAPMALVQSRAKTLSSFAEKAIRKRAKYRDPVHQLTDLCGARVITETRQETEAVCDFIRQTLIVDEANSDDKRNLLGSSEFGYLSVHFVVQLPPRIKGRPLPPEIGARKAEIQVRTLLEHAWASIGHDRLYKSEFRPPRSLQRDMNRVAAVLEEADRAFSALLDCLDRYSGHQGALLNAEQLESETGILRLLLEAEPDARQRQHLVLRLSSLLSAAGRWEEVKSLLEPWVPDGDGRILRDSGNALCRLFCADQESDSYRCGVERLLAAADKDPTDPEAHFLLAGILAHTDPERARSCATAAFHLRPSDPYFLSRHLEYEVVAEAGALRLSLLAPALRAGASICRAHAEAGIELPAADFVRARFHALLGEWWEACEAALRAVSCCLAAEAYLPPKTLEEELGSVASMNRSLNSRPLGMLEEIYAVAVAVQGIPPEPSTIRAPVIVLAGACHRNGEATDTCWENRILAALKGFRGAVISGGTPHGASGIAGALAEASRDVYAVGYCPEDEQNPDPRYHRLIRCGGAGWSVLQPLRMWRDLIDARALPSQVTVIGIGGGLLSALEYAMALGLGARLALIESPDRAYRWIVEDPVWRLSPRLILLPDDPMTLSALLAPVEDCLPPDELEAAARLAHERYRAAALHLQTDPALRGWDDIPEALRQSNRDQIRGMSRTLRAAGYELRSGGAGSGVTQFPPQDVERMAEVEHGRWNAERLSAGWRLGPRDPAKKTSPFLVSWAQLPEKARELDRNAVRAFIPLAAELGLTIVQTALTATSKGARPKEMK